jgi:hypothetical protein
MGFTAYSDEFGSQQINIERHLLSKYLRIFIEDLDSKK